jgi:hypothetical protein
VTPLPVYNWIVIYGTITGGQGTDNIDVDWGSGFGTVKVSASNGCGTSTVRTQNFTGSGCREGEEQPAVSSAQFGVYPNPAHEELTVSVYVNETTGFEMTLEDLSGRAVLSQSKTAAEGLNAYLIDLSRLSKGIYMLEVKSASDNWKTKVVVE